MQYKFYIYKQNVLTNFNKYDLTQYVLLRQITNNAQWSLKIQRDSEFLSVMRTTFNGDISVSGADFTALIALEGSQLQYCVQIQEYCGSWREKWKGYFSYFDYKVDLDRCQLKFTPSPFDIYTSVYDQMDVDRNVLAAETDWIMRMKAYEWPYEVKTVSPGLSTGIPIAGWVEYGAGSQYYLYSLNSEYLYTDEGIDYYTLTYVYKRDYGLSTSNAIDPSGGGGGGAANWTYLEEVSPGVHKWIRPFLNSVYQTYTYQANGNNVYQELITSASQTILLFGLKRLSKVLEYFAALAGLTYTSNFFNDTPCPMGGASLNWTMIQQISNLIEDGAGDQATKGLMKLKDLLLWIRDTFNVYWYIDSNGDFRLEHRKYFDQGLSYTAYFPVIELDLGAYPDNIKHLNRYQWSKPSLVRFEKIETPYSSFSDWTDSNIEYPQMSIQGNDTRTYTLGWGTDIVTMYDTRADLPKQGWVLYNVGLVGAFYEVINAVGAISGASMQNARFSAANLMRDLWTWGRLLPTGNVNGVATTFDSYEKLRKQVELTIPQCCLQLDYNGIFKTELGNGLMESGELDNKGNLKLNLIYE